MTTFSGIQHDIHHSCGSSTTTATYYEHLPPPPPLQRHYERFYMHLRCGEGRFCALACLHLLPVYNTHCCASLNTCETNTQTDVAVRGATARPHTAGCSFSNISLSFKPLANEGHLALCVSYGTCGQGSLCPSKIRDERFPCQCCSNYTSRLALLATRAAHTHCTRRRTRLDARVCAFACVGTRISLIKRLSATGCRDVCLRAHMSSLCRRSRNRIR